MWFPRLQKICRTQPVWLFIRQNHPKYLLEYIACQNANFPFAHISTHEIQCLAFDTNFNYKCQTAVSDLVRDHFTFSLSSINLRDRPEYNTVKTNEEYFEELSLQPDFNYYQTHDFHKLAINLDKRNCFGVLHTHICSLSANLENLELFLTNLDHTFNVICVSETWTSENNNSNYTLNNHTKPRYQKFCGAKGFFIIYMLQRYQETKQLIINKKI